MRSKIVLVLLLTFILVSCKTHLKKNHNNKAATHQWGTAAPAGGSTWDSQGNGTWDNHDATGTWDSQGNGTWDNHDAAGTWDNHDDGSWDHHDDGSWDHHDDGSWDHHDDGSWEETGNFDPANQTEIEQFEDAAENEYVEHIGNLDEFERTYNAYNIQSECFSHLQREELELFLFQGYVRYLQDLYYDLQYQKWWAEYYAQWSSYYEDYYYYEQQYYETDSYQYDNTTYDEAYYQEHYGDGTSFDNGYLQEYVSEEFVPSGDTISQIDEDFEDISHTGDEGYDGQLFELVKLRNKMRARQTSDEDYQAAINLFKLGYMTGFIDGYTDYDYEARNFIHLSFYDQSIFGAYLNQLSRYLENYGCTGDQIRVYYT